MSAVLKNEPLDIRPMRDSDLPTVLEIEREAYSFPWSEGIFRDCLRAGYCCWVVEQRGLLCAYGIMQVGGGESHILNLCVRANGRGQGLGRALLARLLEVAKEHRAGPDASASSMRSIAPRRHCSRCAPPTTRR